MYTLNHTYRMNRFILSYFISIGPIENIVNVKILSRLLHTNYFYLVFKCSTELVLYVAAVKSNKIASARDIDTEIGDHPILPY